MEGILARIDHLDRCGRLGRYEKESKFPVVSDRRRILECGASVIEEPVISVQDCVRHDSARLARIVMDLVLYAKGRG